MWNLNWKYFLYACLGIVAIIFSANFLINFGSKNIITRQLEHVQKDLAARGDGSSLIYDELDTDRDTIRFKRIIYQDGATGGRFALFNVDANANREGLDLFKADRLEWINAQGNLLTLDDVAIQDLRANDQTEQTWNTYLFSRFQASNMNMEGQTEAGEDVSLKAGQVLFSDFDEEVLGRGEMRDITIRYNPELAAHLDTISVRDFDYGQIDEIAHSLQEGYIPMRPFSQLAGTDFTVEGLELEVEGDEVLSSRNSSIDSQRLLQLFLDNAPQELRNILGGDARRLQRNLQDLSEEDPNDLAIGAMELMLQLLRDRNQNAN